MVLFDTNAILRYMLQDNAEMADEVEQRMQEDVCYVPVEVVAELVYVLTKVYGVGRDMVGSELTALIDIPNIRAARDNVVRHALELFGASTLDFVDCLLVGYAHEGYDVVTFDKKLRKRIKELRIHS
jgi:predicted nucleic-acid-binding protein